MKLGLVLLFFLLLPFVFADDSFKPYLHTAAVPDHPSVRLFGQYNTLLFPGAATYTYSLELPPGTHGLSPSLDLYYNSQAMQRPGVVGAGWSFGNDYIYRDINSTPDNTSDDRYLLVFRNAVYELLYNQQENLWHTEVEYHFKIQNVSGAPNSYGQYWTLKTTDGTAYRFGYNANAELTSDTGRNYALRWSLDQVRDTYGNAISYAYTQNPNTGDNGTQYLASIAYDTDQDRTVTFSYESSTRPDQRLVYDQGNILSESRRLSNISITTNGDPVRRYHLAYALLEPGLSTLAQIVRYGADNTSILHTVNLSYYSPTPSFTKSAQWVPPLSFTNKTQSDLGVRIIDLNNDGFADIIQGRKDTSELKAWLNNGTAWVPNTAYAPPVYLSWTAGNDSGTRFADLDNNGLLDLLTSKNGVAQVYLNNGTGWVNATTTWTIPIDFVNSAGQDQGVQLGDLDNDGRVDLLRAKVGLSNLVYLSNGSGWQNVSWSVPVNFTNGSDTGARLIDINGDGLPDIIQANGTYKAWLGNGAGWTDYSSTWRVPVDFTNKTWADTGARLLDVNGDGLPDIVQNVVNGTTANNTWLNNGTGWALNNSWLLPEALQRNASNVGRRLADVNGDGLADIVVAENATANYTWVAGSSTPFLLQRVANEYGGTTTITYTTSTSFNNTDTDGVSDIGFNIFVVSRIAKDNSLSTPFGTVGQYNYSYQAGKYNYTKREFRGFGITTEQQPGALLRHSFYQDGPRRGKEYATGIYSLNGSLLGRNVKDFNYTYLNGIYNISLRSSTDYQYDGASSPRIINTSYFYDWYGNPLSIAEQGDISVAGDERTTNYTYAYNTIPWILNKVAKMSVYDASGSKVRESYSYYDNLGLTGMGSYGALTRQEQWNNNSNNTYMIYEYEPHGNLLRSTDAAGSITQYTYDTTFTYPTVTINALGHITYTSYDLGTGNLLWAKKNDITTSYLYDTHGRLLKEIQPYDSVDLPTKRYSYGLNGLAPVNINVSVRTTANKTQDVSYYYDGFGNLVQLKTGTDTGQNVKDLFYDGSGRVAAEDNPFGDVWNGTLSMPPASTPQTNYTYDALDRVIFVLNTDGTNKTTRFDRANITDYDENGHRHTYTIDALGRISAVFEYNNDPHINLSEEQYITNYSYDQNDNLVRIVDNSGNVFRFSYDSLGRKIAMQDPDMGNWSYAYDARGNLLSQIDGRGQSITLSYDLLNRILRKQSLDVNQSFAYDRQFQGTLSNITQNNDVIAYSYDDRLRVVGKTEQVNNLTFSMSYLYDAANRPISFTDNAGKLDYLFNRQGMVRSIPGFINDSSYDAFGSLLNRTYANGLVQTYTYHTLNHRLVNITIPSVQKLNYSYDRVGNIRSINDLIGGKLSTMTYDNLDRMTEAIIGTDRYAYSYDPLGRMMNIVQNNASKKFVYGGLAHAPSQILDSGAGADVYHVSSLDTRSKNRTTEYFLVNDKASALTGVNTSVSFGNGNTFSANNVTVNTSILFLVQQNYTSAGDYNVNVTVVAPNASDYETEHIKFGVHATGLSIIGANISQRTFEFDVGSDVVETLPNVVWNCSNNLSSLVFNLTSSMLSYFAYNFTSSGSKSMTCNATSSDGNDTLTITFVVQGLGISAFDTLYTNVSRRVVGFSALNSYYTLQPTLNVSYEGASFATPLNISTNEQVLIFAEVNNTLGVAKGIVVNLSSPNDTQVYTNSYDVKGISIDLYNRLDLSNTSKFYEYDVRNLWNDGVVSWTFSDPSITNSSTLANNATLMVLIASNYSQGSKTPSLNASIMSYSSVVQDSFFSRPLALTSLLTLVDGPQSTSEFIVQNYLNSSQNVTWQFDTSLENITSNTSVNSSIIAYVQSNYTSSGVYATRANISGASYTDNRSGVVVA